MPRTNHTRPLDVMVYAAMKEGPAYGYELAARFRKLTGGHIRISYGTIYPLLRRMERTGLMRSRKDRASGRVYYELTKRGMISQERFSSRMKDYQTDMEERLLGFVSMYAAIFGRKALKDLLQHID